MCGYVRVHASVSSLPRRFRVRHRARQLLDGLGWTGAAVAGTVLGHVLTYFAAFVDAAVRHRVLDETGHSYWSFAAWTAAGFAAWSAFAVVARHVRNDSPGPQPQSLGPFHLGSRIAVLQVALFLCLEVGERAVTGAALGELFGHVLPLGLAIQILVAFAIAFVLRGLQTATEALAHILVGTPILRAVRAWPVPVSPPSARRVLLSGAWGLRGPPSA
jgi:hypothetical protein